jgi:hypothetical protein
MPVPLGFVRMLHKEVVSVMVRIRPVRMILNPVIEPHMISILILIPMLVRPVVISILILIMISIPVLIALPVEPLVPILLGLFWVLHEDVVAVVMRVDPILVILHPVSKVLRE